MPKGKPLKKKESVSEDSPQSQSEQDSDEDEYDSEGSGDELGGAAMREADAGNLLNYQTDSDDDDSDDLGVNLAKQKKEL